MEDFPPPEEFKPFQKIYPSKIPRGKYINMRMSDSYQVAFKMRRENKEQKPAIKHEKLGWKHRHRLRFVTVVMETKDAMKSTLLLQSLSSKK